MSAETKEKIAASKRGKPRSAETRAKIAATLRRRNLESLVYRAERAARGVTKIPA